MKRFLVFLILIASGVVLAGLFFSSLGKDKQGSLGDGTIEPTYFSSMPVELAQYLDAEQEELDEFIAAFDTELTTSISFVSKGMGNSILIPESRFDEARDKILQMQASGKLSSLALTDKKGEE